MPGTDLATLITAIAAGVTALVALFALIIQGRRIRRQIGIDNMWRLIEMWDSSDMRRLRATIAQTMLDSPDLRRRAWDESIDVLNTFELLAYLVIRSRTLGVRDAWINFSGWAISWWHVFEPEIREIRRTDHTVYEDYAELVRRFLDHEAKRRGLYEEQLAPTEEGLRDFLESEVRLLDRLKYEPRSNARRAGDSRPNEDGAQGPGQGEGEGEDSDTSS